MAAHWADRKAFAGDEPDIDTARVIAVDDHHMIVALFEANLFEHQILKFEEYGPAFGLDDGKHVGCHIADHPRCVRDSTFIHGFRPQRAPSDPVGPPVGFDERLPWRSRARDDLSADLADTGEPAFIAPQHSELFDECKHARLVGVAISRLFEKCVQFRMCIKHIAVRTQIIIVEYLGAVEKVFDIECGKPHLSPEKYLTRSNTQRAKE